MNKAHKELIELIRRGLATAKMTPVDGFNIENVQEHALVQAEHLLTEGIRLKGYLTRDDEMFTRIWKDAKGNVVASAQLGRLDEARLKSAVLALKAVLPKKDKSGSDKSKTA